MTYQLQIQLSTAAVQQIHDDNQLVTIVKHVTSDPPSTVTLAWLAFPPFMNNIVTWGEDYFLYAATRTAGVVIVTVSAVSQTPVRPGVVYQYVQPLFTPGPAGLAGTYDVENDDPSELLFGLLQTTALNGGSVQAPLSGTSLLTAQRAIFVPSETLSIFVAPPGTNAPVIDSVPAGALTVTFNAARPSATVRYAEWTGRFFVLGGT